MEHNKEMKQARKPLVDRCLDAVERVCNKLPPPAILFGMAVCVCGGAQRRFCPGAA